MRYTRPRPATNLNGLLLLRQLARALLSLELLRGHLGDGAAALHPRLRLPGSLLFQHFTQRLALHGLGQLALVFALGQLVPPLRRFRGLPRFLGCGSSCGLIARSVLLGVHSQRCKPELSSHPIGLCKRTSE